MTTQHQAILNFNTNTSSVITPSYGDTWDVPNTTSISEHLKKIINEQIYHLTTKDTTPVDPSGLFEQFDNQIDLSLNPEIFPLSWLEYFYDYKSIEIKDARIVARFLNHLEEILNNGRLEVYDKLLADIDLQSLNPVFMVSLIRASYSYKDKLNNWVYCRDNIEDHLSALGHDGRAILRGLY